jgi:plastocyanin
VETYGSNKAARRAKVLFCLLACASAVLLLAPTAASAHEGDGTTFVHVTDEGFEPRSVEIGPGDTVTFENVGSEAHWPASDDHPMHTAYPGFDPQKPIAPGEEWGFTFDKPERWAYHDHMNPYLEGEVVVRDEEPESDGLLSSVSSFFSNLYGSVLSAFAEEEEPAPDEAATNGPEERVKRARGDMLALVRDEDPKVALVRLREGIEKDDALLRSCHPLVHDVGRAAYEKYGDFGEAMKYQDEVCNSGYLHGIIETRLSDSDDVLADMKTMCDPYPRGSFLGWQCQHGLGHGAMFYTANDLPRSLGMCDAFGNPFKRSSCANGVFMENFSADQKLHLSAYLKEEDPLYPCAEQADRHKGDCYLYAPTYFLSLNKGDYIGALEWCEGAEADFVSSCVHGVGTQTMKENMSDPKFVESTCMNGKPGQTKPCIEGMVGVYVFHEASLEPARALCGRLEASNRQACYDSVESKSSLFES